MNNYYERKDWPSFPQDRLEEFVDWGKAADRAIPSNKQYPFSMLIAPWSLREWVSQNTPINLDENWIVTIQRFNSRGAPFHVDTIRDWSYNCVIYGEEATTHFKKMKNDSSSNIGPIADQRCDENIACSIRYEKNVWYYHNGSAPHGVTDIPRLRLAVTAFKILPKKLRTDCVGTAGKLVEEWKRDPYFYYA